MLRLTIIQPRYRVLNHGNRHILGEFSATTQLIFTCSKSKIETLEKGVKYFKGNNKNTRRRSGVLIVNFDIFHTFS